MLVTKQFGEQKKMNSKKQNIRKEIKKQDERNKMCPTSGCKIEGIQIW